MKTYLLLASLLLFFSCATKNQTSDEIVTSLADKYYNRILERSPELSYSADIPLSRHDRCTSNSLEDFKRWENFEDSLYTDLSKIKESEIGKNKSTYWILKEELESSISFRVCKRNLWDVTHEFGWLMTWTQLGEFQPVGSDELRKQAITRWNKLPKYINTEIENLKLGISQGYSMPKEIVQLVIDQFQAILDYKTEESPFFLPAKRDSNEAFIFEWTALLDSSVLPAIRKFHVFLKTEYLPAARENVSILANPHGDECYKAYIRRSSTRNLTGEEIFEQGESLVAKNMNDVEQLGKILYKTDHFSEIIKRTEKDTSDLFHSSEEIITYDKALLERAEKECSNWFDHLPSNKVTLKPYKPFESGVASLEEATKSKPAYFRINLQNPTKQQKSTNQITTVHEAYPGHHLQVEFQKDLKYEHPITKILWFGSFNEGWARYSEQLAEEMNLYDSDLPRIKRRAWPGRGMVCDPGVHLKGWTKKQVIDFTVASGKSEGFAVIIYHRMIAWPAQLTSYDVGGEEFKSLRKIAEGNLKSEFNVKEFHSRVLENGCIPLSALRSNVLDWLKTKSKEKII